MKSFKQGLTVTMYKITAGKCKQGREKIHLYSQGNGYKNWNIYSA